MTMPQEVDAPSMSLGTNAGGSRLQFVDALRVTVIAVVIAHHAAQPYGPTGGDWPVSDPANLAWLEPFYFVNAAFGLSLLFLLAGYFVPRAVDRKGPTTFLQERWRRIGVPMLVVALGVHLPIGFLVDEEISTAGDLVREMYDSGLLLPYFHLWFLGHLVLYSVGYVLVRRIAARHELSPRVVAPPGHATIVGFVVALALVTWIVRAWYPIDEWVPLLFVLAAEPARLAQYVAMFAVGVIAARGDWLRRFPTRTGIIWLIIGVTASAGVYALMLLDRDNWGADEFGLRSLVFITWETVICVGMGIGLIVLFRVIANGTHRFVAAMAAASYAAYIVHLTFVVGAQAGLESLDLPGHVKLAIVAIFGIVASFVIGHLSRNVGRKHRSSDQPQPERRPDEVDSRQPLVR